MPPKKPRLGRPPKPDHEKSKVVGTSLTPDQVAYITRRGDGSESRGLRIVVAEAVRADSQRAKS